jgi:hypothetical protein
MKNNKFQSILGGRVSLSAVCEGCIETTSWNQTINNLIFVGLDTADERHLLDQRIAL